ncbi:hypothetical protein SAMN04487951_103279 [Vreelandella arcis]|uniref:Uncharacterized protein n=1 Tax=Vreelandella arcis TaxID=416873 RepID=A0A1G9ZW28_9GAMM|nr:hypothetical protein SAMN04487951_103279 [Halomonas arcis]
MKKAEDTFQELADRISDGTFGHDFSSTEHKIITHFYALCRLTPSVSLVVRLAISPKSNPEGAAWSPCATLFCRA